MTLPYFCIKCAGSVDIDSVDDPDAKGTCDFCGTEWTLGELMTPEFAKKLRALKLLK